MPDRGTSFAGLASAPATVDLELLQLLSELLQLPCGNASGGDRPVSASAAVSASRPPATPVPASRALSG